MIFLMAVKYVLVQKGNPQKPEEPKKWYTQAKSDGDVRLKALEKEITQRCTVNYAMSSGMNCSCLSGEMAYQS
jgi:hypothetical protein